MIGTRVGLHIVGDNLYFGHRTLGELLGSETMTGLMVLAVTGRRPSAAEREVFDAVALILCSADPRIWPLKLTRLVSSYGSTLAGFCAGQLSIEGKQIGPWVVGHAASELLTLREAIDKYVDPEEATQQAIVDRVRRSRIIGYGVPLRDSDERMDALRVHVAKLGRDRLPYWRLQETLSAEVVRERRAAPNVGIGVAAVLLDLGYTPLQASAITTFLNQNVFAANAFEAAQQCEPLMQKLPDESVAYVGAAPRISPRAAASGVSKT